MEDTSTGLTESRLAWPDFVVIAGYFLCVLAVGVWSSQKSQRGSVSGYFLASRNIHWIPMGASFYASNIGSAVLVGLAGAGAASGVAPHGYEQAATYGLLLLGWVFVPVYLSAGVYTMPEYLKLRFGGQRIRIYLSCLSLALYTFTKIAADLYAGAVFLQAALNKSSAEWLYLSVLLLLVVAGAFTISGGLTTVVYTDLMQTVLMVVGAFILAGLSFHAVGGYSSLVAGYPYATASVRAVNEAGQLCGEPPGDYMSLLRSEDPAKSQYPWVGMTFGMAIIQVWYWCTDQVIVQRTLASRSLVHAKGGTILAAYLKSLSLWIMVFPGMAARVLYPDRVAWASPATCLAVCGSERGCSNSAYPELVVNLLPAGLRGLMLAVIMAALISSLTSVFNSASTIFAIDIWAVVRGRLRAEWRGSTPSEAEQVVVGRTVVLVMVVVSVVWIPVIQSNSNSRLFDYINGIISIHCSPICAIFLLAVFWPRANEPGAFWGLMAGMLLGVTRFTAEVYYSVPPCGSGEVDTRPTIIKRAVGDVHYLHFCMLCWGVTLAVAVSVSLITQPIPAACLYRLTFWSRQDTRVRCCIKKTNPITSATSSSLEIEVSTHTNHTSEHPPQPTTASTHNHTTDVPWWLGVARKVCGVKQGQEATPPQLTQEEMAQRAVDFLTEPPFWRRFVNINAIICITIGTFVYGFYA